MSAGAGFMLSRTVSTYQKFKNKVSLQTERLPASYRAPRTLAESEDELNVEETDETKGTEDTEEINNNTIADLGDELLDPYEQSLYRTYINYYSQQVSPQDWERITSGRDIYTIRENDTLWDISKVLFDDPNYWPKLWSVNPSLSNPHFILPGVSLGFIHGTAGQAPSMVILDPDAKKQEELKSKKEPLPDFLKTAKIKVPPPKKSAPVLYDLPDSLPVLYFKSKDAQNTLANLDIQYEKPIVPHITLLPYYMASKRITGPGKISDKKYEGIWSSTNESIILEMQEPVNPGQRLMIVKNLGKLVPSGSGIQGPFGYEIEIQGEVQVVGRLKDSFDLYEANVMKTLSPIITESYVVNQQIPKLDFLKTNINGTEEAQIIGFPPFAKSRKVGTLFSLLYLNRGSNSGFSVGQMYQVEANPRVRKDFPYGYNIKLGELKIIQVEDRFATGVITSMSTPIKLGDHVVPMGNLLSTESGYDPFTDEDVRAEEDIILEEKDTTESFEDRDEEDLSDEDFEDEDRDEEFSDEDRDEEDLSDEDFEEEDEEFSDEDFEEEDREEEPSDEDFEEEDFEDEDRDEELSDEDFEEEDFEEEDFEDEDRDEELSDEDFEEEDFEDEDLE